ncbi:response regulator [Roseomonas indoligenes]|uniref:Response regulator n=1 Tax=Roseomonas indoligenes TaxID=2820811 RepID=A0A940S4J5_9PROT|nr:response regulator [Pararoseomonas indoligenes]MBP0492044.1 response regulator [Pararoseomonas indoligenes]
MPDAPGPLAGCRVLLVEDEYVIADEMDGWLRQAGAVVLGPVPDVDGALDLIEREAGALDVAVLDANLGDGETAYPVADRLEELGVPFLFATGDVRLVDEPSYQSRTRLEKPVTQRGLVRALQSLVPPRGG